MHCRDKSHFFPFVFDLRGMWGNTRRGWRLAADAPSGEEKKDESEQIKNFCRMQGRGLEQEMPLVPGLQMLSGLAVAAQLGLVFFGKWAERLLRGSRDLRGTRGSNGAFSFTVQGEKLHDAKAMRCKW